MERLDRKKVAFVTLGCKVNQYETQIIRENFQKLYFDEVSHTDSADIFVINSCTVTSRSDKKTRKIIRQLKRQNSSAKIIMTGCYAERDREEVATLTDVDLIVGNDKKEKIAFLIHDLLGNYSIPNNTSELLPSTISELRGRTRSFVKIQDGCQAFCSYCIIPYVRSNLTSKPEDEVIKEIKQLQGNEVKEVVLVGIHLGQYGKETKYTYNLTSLLAKLSKFDGLRIRLSSIEMREVTEEILDIIASSNTIVPHIHIPLQSGDQAILKKMNRHYTPDEYISKITHIRTKLTNPAITSDVIVGFPGETEEQFENTAIFCNTVQFSRMHIFPYSDRSGTSAFVMPNKISDELKKRE